MTVVRRLIAQRHLAMLICVAALVMKLIVPAGYMIGTQHGRVAIEICSGVASEPMAMPGMHGDMPDHGGKDHGRVETPCAFSGLSVAALGAVDPIQLATFIAFVMAIGFRPAALPVVARRVHLRPPLRGPPAGR